MTSDFSWGVSTSAYQIEGGRGLAGKGDSIWDTFSDLGRLREPGDIACDHYHRWEQDLDLLADLGVDSYRFSVAWTRVIPDGDGEVNPDGVLFYKRLIQGLVERGIEPVLTLYHWDLPQALQARGGWINRQTIDAFARYAGVLAETFGEDVALWITHNEPWVSSMLGYVEGVFAPGVSDWSSGLLAAHHMLTSHGLAMDRVRQASPSAKVGIALDCRPSAPANERAIEAARHFDGYRNRWFFDPVFGMGYPVDIVETHEAKGRLPRQILDDRDLDIIGSPIDFVGINYYTTVEVDIGGEESDPREGPTGFPAKEGFTEMGWRIDPLGLTDFLNRVGREYQPSSILVTENGASFSDGPDKTGRIRDQRRIDYLKGHINAALVARELGVPVDGYFVWSLMDNIEWLEGWDQRFGLVWVDPVTKERIPKTSFYWYRDRISIS